jgi:hypothetical protein
MWRQLRLLIMSITSQDLLLLQQLDKLILFFIRTFLPMFLFFLLRLWLTILVIRYGTLSLKQLV